MPSGTHLTRGAPQLARSEMTLAKYNGWLDAKIGNYYATYVRRPNPFCKGCARSALPTARGVDVPQIKPGKVDPYFHCMFGASLLSFGAMYPYALGACPPARAPPCLSCGAVRVRPIRLTARHGLAEEHIEKNPSRFLRCVHAPAPLPPFPAAPRSR